MTTPPPDDFEHDRTGMRDLLQSLPSPGAMPTAVEQRISDALARESVARGTTGSAESANVTPLARRQDGRGATGSATTSSARGTNRRGFQVVGGLVAAAAVAAVAVVGVNALNKDQAPTSAIPSAAASSDLADRVQVESSGTDYTTSSFNAQAASMSKSASSASPSGSQLERLGSLASISGILQCAKSVGGSLMDDPDRVRVDVATFEGKPALIVSVRKGSTDTAFAVSTTCSKGTRPYAEPRTV